MLAAAHCGHSSVLVLRGEAGIGKSALMEYAAEHSEGCRVLRSTGVQSEMELPFAGLHQLCVELLDGRERLPEPQTEAIATAFGLSLGVQPDRFLVGLAVLTLLSNAAEERPLLCLVDDVQWLDRSSAQVLGFVARRLAAESVALLFAEREPSRVTELAGLPELSVGGLANTFARQLLTSVFAAPVDESVRGRLLAETRGNPLALLELPRDFSLEQLAGGFGLPPDGSVPGQIEASFLRRVRHLPPETQRLLLLAAADPTGEPALFVRAAEEIGVPVHRLSHAEADGLVELGVQVTFRHPLLRSAIYRSASSDERRAAHRALAVATNRELDPDRRSWHRAHATAGPDEDVAFELEQSAARARARGGLPAAAAFLERSAALTPDPTLRAHRAVEAAANKQLAGASQEALRLLVSAAAGPLEPLDRARRELLHGLIELDLMHAVAALPLLLDAAVQLSPLDVSLSREAYLHALLAAHIAGRFGPGMREVAIAALDAPGVPGEPRAMDLLVDALAARFTGGYAASISVLETALAALREEGNRKEVSVRWPWFARRVAAELFADDSWHYFASRSVQRAREAGALGLLPVFLHHLAHVRCVEGELDGARDLLEEADAIAIATGAEPLVWGKLALAGFRGLEPEASALFEMIAPAATAQGDEGVVLTYAEYGRAVLYNGLGRYNEALLPAHSAGMRDELLIPILALPELVEAATHTGQAEVAREAIEHLAERTTAAGTDWGCGIEARSKALMSDGEAAETLYREAIDRLGRTRIAFELARAHLVFGEWLRRERRPADARDRLRRAREMFTSMGADAFAARAGRELLAAGETGPKRGDESRDELTAQERQIARFARDGLTNVDIGARLFISPRTVEYHLRKVFTKLGITGRERLDRVL